MVVDAFNGKVKKYTNPKLRSVVVVFRKAGYFQYGVWI
jgi:hypothetical protein